MRWRSWLIGVLLICVIIGAIYFPILRRRLRQAAKTQQQTEEQARRELVQTVPTAPGEQQTVKAQLFWSSGLEDGSVTPVTVELPLSKDAVARAKQLLDTLLAGPVDTELRTLPPDAALLEFYLLPDGTAVADFSEALATSTPSGIESEQMAVDSITKTLQANVPQVQRLKILIHGQEADTLAGHLDLTGTFPVNLNAASGNAAAAAPLVKPAADASQGATSASAGPVSAKAIAPASAVPQIAPGAIKLTANPTIGKLATAERKP